MELRPVNFPVEEGELLTQGEILSRERCSEQDQAPDEQKESGDESHKCEANHRKKDEPDDRAEWLMISLTASMSTRDGVFGRDTGLIRTSYGLLDPNPAPGQRILPRNYGRGPGSVTVNLRVAKIIEFGGERGSASTAQRAPGGGDGRPAPGVFNTGAGPQGGSSSAQAGRRYNLSISMSVRNLLNHTNPGPIIGNITSPLFGQANQPAGGGGFIFSEAANNRRLELQMRFTF